MNDEMPPFPNDLSDEAAFALSETLHWLALLCDEKYFAQIRRHMATLNHLESIDPEQPWSKNNSF